MNGKITVRFSSVFNEESSTKVDNSIMSVDKDPHFKGYFYIIKKENIADVKKTNTGYFVFLD